MPAGDGFGIGGGDSIGEFNWAHVKLQRNGFDFIFLDRIYRIDGIFFAFGEEPFRPKAVLSR